MVMISIMPMRQNGSMVKRQVRAGGVFFMSDIKVFYDKKIRTRRDVEKKIGIFPLWISISKYGDNT
jgi:glutamate mutase epsilon subunit